MLTKPVTVLAAIILLAAIANAQSRDAAPAAAGDAAAAMAVPDAAPVGKDAGAVGEEPGQVDPIGTTKDMWAAFKGGKYREAIAGALVLLLFLWRRFAAKLIIGKLSSWWVGFITVLLGYVGSIPEALTADSFKWGTFIWAGLLTSGEAMLMWQMLGKRVLPKVFGDPAKP